jgi:uncharacterized alpha-E superfamily protein
MISRVADHCFWLGRYLDRAESTARLLQVTRALAFDSEMPEMECWRPLVTVSGQYPDFVARFGREAAANSEVVQRYMTWATENPVSVRSSIRAAREGARSIREVLSQEIWQAINELFLWFSGEEASTQYVHDRDEVYRHVRRSTQLNLGLVRSTMLHDTAMDLLWLGVLLERVGQTARILDMHHHILDGTGSQHQVLQTALWLSLLRTCSGFDAFMRQHQGRVTQKSVVSFLIYENRFPRSLRYCVHSAVGVMGRIWSEAEGGVAADQIDGLRQLQELDDWLNDQHRLSTTPSIHELLTHVVDEIAAICAAIHYNIAGEGQRGQLLPSETPLPMQQSQSQLPSSSPTQ